MKKDRKRKRHNYLYQDTLGERQQIQDKEYFGIFIRHGRVHVDTKRFLKMLKRRGAEQFWRDGMAKNRHTPYLIPAKAKKSDYMVNVAFRTFDGLLRAWRGGFATAMKGIPTPDETGEAARVSALATRIGEDAYEESYMIGLKARLEAMARYEYALSVLYAYFVQRIIFETERAILLMMNRNGHAMEAYKRYKVDIMAKNLVKKRGKKKLSDIASYSYYQKLIALTNFLKHGDEGSYSRLEKACPEFLNRKMPPFASGGYALDWLAFPKGFIEDTQKKMEAFLADFSSTYFSKTPEEIDPSLKDIHSLPRILADEESLRKILQIGFINRISSDCDRLLMKAFARKGIRFEKGFSEEALKEKIPELSGGDESKRIEDVQGYGFYRLIARIGNFAKHDDERTYGVLKRNHPEILLDPEAPFEGGSGVIERIALPEGFIESSIASLKGFFTAFCATYFGEDPEEAEWNHDTYFLWVYDEISDYEVYVGIYDKWGNCLVG
ncbi:MAG: hypothetical protein K6F32_01085 [Bacilli bacterium]|nr:hypothetical protein [Bacilli bacterium]